MTIEAAIVERLLALTPLTNLVGDKVYLLRVQQGKYPAVRVQSISENAPMHLRGPVNLQATRIQVDAFARADYAGAAAIANAVHGDGLGPNASGLFGFIGDLGGSPALIHVCCVDRVLKRTSYEPDELQLVRIQQDYMVEWKAL